MELTGRQYRTLTEFVLRGFYREESIVRAEDDIEIRAMRERRMEEMRSVIDELKKERGSLAWFAPRADIANI